MTLDLIYRYDPHESIRGQSIDTSEQALHTLAAGNARFAEFVARMQAMSEAPGPSHQMVVPINPFTLGIPLVPGMTMQHAPYALVLGCSDARAPIEHVLDCSPNDVFVVRVAGNVLGLECLGSIDYAVANLHESLRSVIVMGHTGCGAITAAVDVYLSPSEFTEIASSHAVRSLIDRLMLAVRGSARALDRRLGSQAHRSPEYRRLLIDTAIFMNAAVTAWDLQREVNAVGSRPMSVVYSVYDIARARISSLPLGNDSPPAPFAISPTASEDFSHIAEAIVARLIP